MLVQIYVLGRSEVVRLNRRTAIRKRCIDCAGGDRKAARDCEMEDCPLHPFRMGKGRQDAKKRQQAVRDYCLWCMAGQKHLVNQCHQKDCPFFAYRLARVDRSVELAN